ncbi:MAG: O-antigen ligase family protein [Nitrosospira sp.]
MKLKNFSSPVAINLVRTQEGGLWKVLVVSIAFGLAVLLGMLVPILGFNSASSVLILFLILSLVILLGTVTYFAIRSRTWALIFFLAISVFLIDATIRQRELTEQGFDMQSLIKFAIWCAALLIAFFSTRKFSSNMLRGDIKWLTLFSLLGLASTAYSLTPIYTFGAGIAAISYCALAICVAEHLTKQQILYSLLGAISIVLALSLAVFAFGDGMAASEGDSTIRLAGITGSANSLGRTASLAILVIAVLVFGHRLPLYSWRCLVPLGLALTCLLLSDSRTATLAVIAALGLYLLRLRPILGFTVVIAGAVSGLLLLNLNIPWEQFGKSLARTGRVSEMTTLTGRTEIWHATWTAFLEQPLLGYGFAATKVLLPEVYRSYWGFTVTQAHNFFLQTAVTTGLVGLAFVLMALIRQGIAFITRPQLFSGLIFIYLLVYGITEPGPIGPAPNILTLFWALSLCWDRVRDAPVAKEIIGAIPKKRKVTV